jgi:hypothetical protein
LKKLSESPVNELERFQLVDCFESYFPSDEEQTKAIQELLKIDPNEAVKAMNKTTYDRGIEVGIEKGIEKGLGQGEANGIRRSIRNLLKRRFPKSKQTFTPMLDELTDLDRLDELLEIASTAKSMAEFRKLLKG